MKILRNESDFLAKYFLSKLSEIPNFNTDIGSSFNKVSEYLTLVGRNGIVLNSEKFHFAEDEVDWAGIRVTMDKC